MSLKEKAKTAAEIYNKLSSKFGLKHKELVEKANQKWVPLEVAEQEIQKLEADNKNLRENWDGYQAQEEEIQKLRSELEQTKEVLKFNTERLRSALAIMTKGYKELEGKIADIRYQLQIFPFIEGKDNVDEAQLRQWLGRLREALQK